MHAGGRPCMDAPLDERLGQEGHLTVDGDSHPVFVVECKASTVGKSAQLLITSPAKNHRGGIQHLVHRNQCDLRTVDGVAVAVGPMAPIRVPLHDLAFAVNQIVLRMYEADITIAMGYG